MIDFLIKIRNFSVSFLYFLYIHQTNLMVVRCTWFSTTQCLSFDWCLFELGVHCTVTCTYIVPSRESSQSLQCMTIHVPALSCSSLASCLTLLFRRNRNSRLWWEELSGSCSSDSRIRGWAKWRQLQSKNSVVTEVDLRLLGSSSFSS